MSAPRRIAQFVFAGAVGFGVDAALLALLVSYGGWPPVAARVPSFLVAVSCTWLINRYLAFADRRAVQAGSALREYGRYLLSQSAGAALNLGIFALLLWFMPQWQREPVLPLALASACAMAFNYLAMGKFVFRAQRRRSAQSVNVAAILERTD
jgi:putative flippase GtrA